MLTHMNANNQPTMVDVSAKLTTARRAKAQAQIQLPEALQDFLQGEEVWLKKGPVFQTAIIAGTMAVKKTAEAIPFCHTIPIESCQLAVHLNDQYLATVTCEVKTTGKTGVEMEALHGATIAALTIYDMCKAVSPDMVIGEVRLLEKSGGKSDLHQRPVYGLVLTGGQSKRMQRDKALLDYQGQPHARYLYYLLEQYCEKVYLSARPQQWQGTTLEQLPMLLDPAESQGPITGIYQALQTHPEVNWLVLACDLAYVQAPVLEKLLAQHDPTKVATCYQNSEQAFPEALCALYTPQALGVFEQALAQEQYCPVKILQTVPCQLVPPDHPQDIANINTPQAYEQAIHDLRNG